MKPIVTKVLDIAKAEDGVREGKANRGERVDEYQRSDTLPGVGYAWCASFVAWCLKKASDKIPYCYSASCDVVLVWGRKAGIVYNTPEAGDIFLLLAKNSNNDAIHTGFVTSVDGAEFGTIEGNTNLNGSREGIGVFSRKRSNSSRYRFVRWHELMKGEEATPADSYAVKIGAKQVDSIMVGGACWVAVREWGEALGFEVGWNNDEQLVLFGGKEVDTQTRMHEGKAYAWIRDLARFSSLKLVVSNDPKTILVTK